MSVTKNWSKKVLGDTGNEYLVAWTKEKGYSCSCKSWTDGYRRPCKHVNRALFAHAKDLAKEMAMSDVAVTMSGAVVDVGTGEVLDHMPADTTHGPYNADGGLAKEGDLVLDDPVIGVKIKPQFLVTLQGGKQHPTWAGVLDAGHELGLEKIKTELIQIPEEKNGNVAIVKATAYFKDGREFDAYGDASLANVKAPAVRVALIRMAETRAKGRAVRDGINCGEVLSEEFSDLSMTTAPAHASAMATQTPATAAAPAAATNGAAVPQSQMVTKAAFACSECNATMTPAQVTLSKHKYSGSVYCIACQKKHAPAQAAVA